MRRDLSGGHCHSWGVPLAPGKSPHRVLGVTLGMAQGSPGGHQKVTAESRGVIGVGWWDQRDATGVSPGCHQGVTVGSRRCFSVSQGDITHGLLEEEALQGNLTRDIIDDNGAQSLSTQQL